MAVLGLHCCARASVVVARGLSSHSSRAPERRLSSCGSWAQLLRGMWDPPGPGLEPVSPRIGRQTLNHCATREAPKSSFLNHLLYPFNDSIKSNVAVKNILENYAVSKKWFTT